MHSEDVENAVDELESMGLLSIQTKPTYGGDAVYSYHLTGKGADRAERLIQWSDEDESIRDVYEEYGDVPVSNLLNDIVQSEPAYVWSE